VVISATREDGQDALKPVMWFLCVMENTTAPAFTCSPNLRAVRHAAPGRDNPLLATAAGIVMAAFGCVVVVPVVLCVYLPFVR
jgi:hypothetical protein